MIRIKIGDAVVPVSNIDTVYINDYDKKKLNIFTLGGFTLSAKFDKEEQCRSEFERIVTIIDNYLPSMIIKITNNETENHYEETT